MKIMTEVSINKQARLSQHLTLSSVATLGNLSKLNCTRLGFEKLIRYATILLDISDESQEDFDELLLERSPKGTYWLHFAVRPSGNRRRVRLIQT